MKLIKYIKVKTGEYQKDGKTKGRYQTVGRVLQDDKGGKMYLLDRTFNPAGVPGEKESVILNMFDAEEPKEAPAASREQHSQFNDEIPF